MWRQGDLLIVSVPKIPQAAAGRTDRVLAKGEATGHCHRIEAGELLETLKGELFMRLAAPTQVVHEEHAAIRLPAGTYRVIRQREFSGESTQPVWD